MIKLTTVAVLLATALPAQAELIGTYLRNDTEPMTLHTEDGLLYCTRVSDGYEICNGMEAQGAGSWQGDKLKNPDMPGFMKFSGSITLGDGEVMLEGCTMGGSMCKTLTWPAQ